MADLAASAGESGRGWEIIVASLSERDRGAVDRGSEARHADRGWPLRLEIGQDIRPERVVADLAAAGATLVSVTPLRTSLEDVFVKALESSAPAPDGAARGRG